MSPKGVDPRLRLIGAALVFCGALVALAPLVGLSRRGVTVYAVFLGIVGAYLQRNRLRHALAACGVLILVGIVASAALIFRYGTGYPWVIYPQDVAFYVSIAALWAAAVAALVPTEQANPADGPEGVG